MDNLTLAILNYQRPSLQLSCSLVIDQGLLWKMGDNGYIYTYVYICMYVCMHACMYVCMYMKIVYLII